MPPAAASPSQVPAVISSQTASLATANAGGASTLVGPGRSQGGVSLPPTAAVVSARSTVSGQPVGVHEKTTVGAAAVQPRPILPAPPTATAQGTGTAGTGGINMAGLNMLAAVGARQQQQLQQQQQQQATASPQPPQAKVYMYMYMHVRNVLIAEYVIKVTALSEKIQLENCNVDISVGK